MSDLADKNQEALKSVEKYMEEIVEAIESSLNIKISGSILCPYTFDSVYYSEEGKVLFTKEFLQDMYSLHGRENGKKEAINIILSEVKI